jgi:FMNH2-dependent dimethyl sulfone monooxygenase
MVFQGGQSDAARAMAASHSDWMFLNGGPPEKIAAIIDAVRARARTVGRTVRFALYGIPLCRATDAGAEAEIEAMVERTDPALVAIRRARVGGASGRWAPSDDALTTLDSNEGYATRLIGSPETILRRMFAFHDLGVDMFHLTLHDELFNREVLPALQAHR